MLYITGITPAHAGKSLPKFSVYPDFQDHPRACGEKNNLRQAFAVQQGSPPRVRGKVDRGGKAALCGGITPAHAGKSI